MSLDCVKMKQKKAFELYFEQLMPDIKINIQSIVHRDFQFIIKTKSANKI